MILGIGIDIIEISRIEKALQSEYFKKMVFTVEEISYAEKRKKMQFSSYAARWAAKEALIKALGVGIRLRELRGIEVQRSDGTAPAIMLHGYWKDVAHKKGVANIHLSLTHAKDYAVATCILEGGRA